MTPEAKPRRERPLPLPFRYPGSKGYVMSQIVDLLPPHDHFVDVFGGTAAAILRKPPSKLETYNDVNCDLCNVFVVLRNRATRRRLCQLLSLTPHSRRQFEWCLRNLQNGIADPVKRAWAYLVVSNQARAGLDPTITHPGAWGFQRKYNRRDRWPSLTEFLERVGDRFREVQVENREWEYILAHFDSPSTLFFLDPPYPLDVRITTRLYKHEMSGEDHQRLLERVQRLQGFVVLCSYANPLYLEYLASWRAFEIETRCFISPRKIKPPRTEIVWMNFEYR